MCATKNFMNKEQASKLPKDSYILAPIMKQT